MNETILLADNDPDFLKSRKALLEQEGYNVLCASTPAEAEKALETFRLDLAILDLRLRKDRNPNDRSGLDLARDTDPTVPKIILTQFPSEEALRESLAVTEDGFPPAVEFISKNEDFDELLKAIRKGLKVSISWFDRTQAGITRQLNKNYEEARKRATIHFWLGLSISIVLTVPVVLGVMMAVTGNQAIGVASAAGSIVAEICNYLFFSRIDKTNRTVADHHQELLQSKRLENLIAAADKLSDLEKRNSMIMRIIETAAAGWLTTALRQDVSERKSLQN